MGRPTWSFVCARLRPVVAGLPGMLVRGVISDALRVDGVVLTRVRFVDVESHGSSRRRGCQQGLCKS